jgi:hypothetical protein
MELGLKSLFELHVRSCTHWMRPRNSPPPPELGSYTRALVSLRRHLFVTLWLKYSTAAAMNCNHIVLIEMILSFFVNPSQNLLRSNKKIVFTNI